MSKIYKIGISPRQLIRVLFVLGLALLAIRLVDTLLTIFIAFIIMAATKPAATFLNKRLRMSEGASIGVVFVLVFTFLGITFYMIGKPLTEEIARFTDSVPQLSDNIVNWLSNLPVIHSYFNPDQLRGYFNDVYGNLANQFNSVVSTVGNTVLNAFQGILSTLFILVFSIYLYLERNDIKKYIVRAFRLNSDKFNTIYDQVESQLGAWVRGQLLLALSVGLATYIGLLILDVKYALPLGILAGILEIVPVIGPIITGVILTLIGLSISPLVGALSLVLSILIQQLENNLLVPVIMKRAVGLSPVVTIISILVGQELFGILGAIIAVPSAAMLTVIINTYLDDRDHKLRIKKTKKENNNEELAAS